MMLNPTLNSINNERLQYKVPSLVKKKAKGRQENKMVESQSTNNILFERSLLSNVEFNTIC